MYMSNINSKNRLSKLERIAVYFYLFRRLYFGFDRVHPHE